MDDGEVQLGRDHRAGGGGIDVADHDQPIGAVGVRDLLIGDHDAAGLLGMAAGTDAEMVIGLRQPQIREDRVRHVGIIMLAGMDQHRIEAGAAVSACQSGATFMKLGRAAATR
jgi:hypothetical protein